MTRVDWQQVHDDDYRVPEGPSLSELTEELTLMLGDADPARREGTGCATLLAWVSRGIYDDLLSGFGDGMVAGLRQGLEPTSDGGGPDAAHAPDDTVLRRAGSARVLAACIRRDTERPLVLGGKVLQWGDALATWLLREQDLRGVVPGRGRAAALAAGGDAMDALAASPHLGAPELTVVLDVVADRLLAPVPTVLAHGETDAMARATLTVLRRGRVPMKVLEPWVTRLAVTADAGSVHPRSLNAQAFLRSLYLHLALGNRPPEVRADLMLVLVGALRSTNPF